MQQVEGWAPVLMEILMGIGEVLALVQEKVLPR